MFEIIEDYYIGEIIAIKGKMEIFKIIFTGSEQLDNMKWRVNFVLINNSGYAGAGANMNFVLQNGEKIRFGEGYKSFEENKKKKLKELDHLQFEKIEKDCIKVRVIFK